MAVGLALFAGMTGLALALGLYLQLGLGYTPLQAGLAQAPWALPRGRRPRGRCWPSGSAARACSSAQSWLAAGARAFRLPAHS